MQRSFVGTPVRVFVAVCMSVALGACEGPMGPAGAPGPGTRLVVDAVANASGIASVDLPPEAGTLDSPPVVACYVSIDGASWIVIAFDSDTDTDVESGTDAAFFVGCFLDPGTQNNISVVVEGIPTGWLFRVVAVY